MDMTKLPLLRKVMEHAVEHPDECDLASWGARTPCGTTLCLAGRAADLAGARLHWATVAEQWIPVDHGWQLAPSPPRGTLIAVTVGGMPYPPGTAGALLLGLNHKEAHRLFHAADLHEAWAVVEDITGGALTRLG